MERILACSVEDLAKGCSMTVSGERAIALHRTDDGAFHATSDTCTHEKWSLGTDGDLEGNEIICPLHMARFNVATGEALCLPATAALQSYPVEIVGDSVYVVI